MKVLRYLIVLIAVVLICGLVAGLSFLVFFSNDSKIKTYEFPEDFKVGAASASYQIEGGVF